MKSLRFKATAAFSLLASLLWVTSGCRTTVPGDSARLPLWKVEGVANQVYLLGSVHLLFETNYPLPTPMEAAFNKAQVVAFEADVGDMMQLDKQMDLMRKGKLGPGESMTNLVSRETYERLLTYAHKSGLPEMVFTEFKPGFVAMNISSLEAVKLGMNPAYGIDLHFYTQAKDAGKEIVPLETLEYQMGVLTDMSKEDAEALLKSTLDQVAKPDMGLTDLVNAWQEGDVKKLDQLMNDSFGDTPKVQSSLLDRRNENWMPKIVEMIQSGKNAIIIVGAGHLVGERGLVRSLENRGFKVVQQNSSPRLADLRQ